MSKIGSYIIEQEEKGNDLMALYDKPIEIPCYEKWIEGFSNEIEDIDVELIPF